MITENAVFSDMVTIDASVETVWAILIDFKNYKKWNNFCPSIQAKLTIGSDVDMQVDLGNGLQQQIEQMVRIEPLRELVWGMVMGEKSQLRALRTQTLIQVNESRCCYVTVDWFSGELTKAVIDGMGSAVEVGFNQCAYGLKTYAEQQ